MLEGGDIGEQSLGDRRQSVHVALLEQRVFEAMETAEVRVLFAFFEVIGAGVDCVVQFSQALSRRGQSLIRGAGRQVQGLSLAQVTGCNGLIECGNGFDQRRALAAQVDAELRQRPDKRHHRRLGFGCRIGRGSRRDVQGAARIAQQSAGDRVVAGQQVGVDHQAQAWCDVLAFFDHQNAVEDFPFNGTVGAVDDAETGATGRHRQGIRLAAVRVNRHQHFIVVGLALGGGHFRGVVEQAAGGDHHDHRTGHRPAQGSGWGDLGWSLIWHGCPY
ncbi:hypothetical protein D3C85_1171230 [compost metagenome]